MLEIDDILDRGPVMPILEIPREDDAEPLAEALSAGGVSVIEVTLRTEAALPAIRRLAQIPGIIVGAGTVLNATHLAAAKAAGAKFVVSPGLTTGIAQAARNEGMPLLPGVATGSEIMMGLDLGLTRFKFFPAETSGGAAAVAAFAGPFRGVRFCPTGGISAARAPDYLGLSNVACVGGSWVAPRDVMVAGDWPRIAELALRASTIKRG